MAISYVPYVGTVVTRKQAMAEGLQRYFMGPDKPCKRGHVSQRKTGDGKCIQCTRIAGMDAEQAVAKRVRSKAWDDQHREEKNAAARERQHELRATDPEKLRARWRENYRRNPAAGKANRKRWNGANKERMKAYVLANKEKLTAAAREWQKRNADRVRAKVRKWHQDNKETLKVLRQANPEQNRAIKQRRRAREAAAEGSHTAADLRALFAEQSGQCAYCRTQLGKGYHVDHVVPLSKGGSNWIGNIKLACGPCNVRKWAIDHDEFLKRLGNTA